MVQLRLPPNSRVWPGKHYVSPEVLLEGTLPLERSPDTGENPRTERLSICRYTPGVCETPRLDVYDLAGGTWGTMVLDALLARKNRLAIKDHLDPSLTFRRSCRKGVFGSWAMNINGANTLACITPLPLKDGDSGGPGESQVVIYPLSHLPVIKDLVCDLSHLYRQYATIRPWLQTASPPPSDGRARCQSPAQRDKLDAGLGTTGMRPLSHGPKTWMISLPYTGATL